MNPRFPKQAGACCAEFVKGNIIFASIRGLVLTNRQKTGLTGNSYLFVKPDGFGRNSHRRAFWGQGF